MNETKMTQEIIQFLCKAKKETYAGKGKESKSSRPNSHDLQYQEGDLLYIDTYLGGVQFAGEEALWVKNKPLWSMNYIGHVVGDHFSGDFLKEALLHVPEEYPFRGPKSYVKGDYTYQMIYDGDIDWFNGTEFIYYKDKLVYHCIFHGCIIQ